MRSSFGQPTLDQECLATRIRPNQRRRAIMTTATASSPKTKGGEFLIRDLDPHEIFTAEDLSEERLAIAHTTDEFWTKEVEPNLESIHQQRPGVALGVLRKAAELGLTAI